MPGTGLEKSQSSLDELLQERKLWKLSSQKDSFVRRAVYRLLLLCLEQRSEKLNRRMLSAIFLTSGLHADQIGASLDFTKVLVRLMQVIPSVWTSDYEGEGKKSASNRLLYFLKKGSQGAASEYWALLATLFDGLNGSSILIGSSNAIFISKEPGKTSCIADILEAFRTGLSSKNEQRSATAIGWSSYLEVFKILVSHEADSKRALLLKSNCLPLITRYLDPSSQSTEWSAAVPQQQELCLKACAETLSISADTFQSEWQPLSTALIEIMQILPPEQASEYTKAQDSFADRARRWYGIQKALHQSKFSGLFDPICSKTLASEITAAITLLRNRQGKPYGAAAALEAATSNLSNFILDDAGPRQALVTFINNDVPQLMLSPSTKYLLAILDSLESVTDIGEILESCLQVLEQAAEGTAKTRATRALLQAPCTARSGLLSLQRNPQLRSLVDGSVLKNDAADWDLVGAAVSNPGLPDNLLDDLVHRFTAALDVQGQDGAGLRGLHLMAGTNQQRLQTSVGFSENSALMKKLMRLCDSSEETASKQAQQLVALMEASIDPRGNDPQRYPITILIEREMDAVTADSLS